MSLNMHCDGIQNDSVIQYFLERYLELQEKKKTMSLKHAILTVFETIPNSEKILKTMSLKHAF